MSLQSLIVTVQPALALWARTWIVPLAFGLLPANATVLKPSTKQKEIKIAFFISSPPLTLKYPKTFFQTISTSLFCLVHIPGRTEIMHRQDFSTLPILRQGIFYTLISRVPFLYIT